MLGAVSDINRQLAVQVMDSMGQGLGLVDAAFCLSFVNPALAKLLGQEVATLIGMPFWSLIDQHDHPRAMAAVQARQERQAVSFEANLIHRDATRVPVLLTCSPGEEKGQRSMTVCVVTDLTERRAAELIVARSESLHRAIAAHFPDGAVLLFDHDLRYTLVDGEGLSRVGLSKEIMQGRTVREVMRAPLSEQVEPDYRAALAGHHVTRELRFAHIHFLVHYRPVRDDSGAVIAGLVMALDITERKNMELALELEKRRAQRSEAYARTLVEVSKLALAELEPQELARQAVMLVAAVADVDWTGLCLSDARHTRVVSLDPASLDEAVFAPLFSGDGRLPWSAPSAGAPAPVYLSEDAPGAKPDAECLRLGVSALAWVPFASLGGRTYALAAVRTGSGRAWQEDTRDLFSAAARIVQAAASRQVYWQQLEQAALIDALTGLANRRAFDRDHEAAMAAAERHAHALGLVVMDIDGLKQINDTRGHDQGDELLRSFARALRATLRREDRLYRLSGDEFAVLLDRARPEDTEVILERIRSAVALVRLQGFADADVSAGIAFSTAEPCSARDLFRLADHRMYTVKHGRKSISQPR